MLLCLTAVVATQAQSATEGREAVTSDSLIALQLRQEGVTFSHDNSVTLLMSGQEKFDDMFKAIKKARKVAFEDLGMEAIYEFEVVDMPVTVAVDAKGNNIHESGPAYWKAVLQDVPVKNVE